MDFCTYVTPIIYYITIYGKFAAKFYNIILIISFIVFILILLYKIPSCFIETCDNEQINCKMTALHLEMKVIRLSINVYRTSVFIITSVAIIACDFKIFERLHAKTRFFGISLMDLGVGLFIVCHSMRIIRNADGETVIKKSFRR